jgi:pimeloyl-ACP methyl ester carboxylesterase
MLKKIFKLKAFVFYLLGYNFIFAACNYAEQGANMFSESETIDVFLLHGLNSNNDGAIQGLKFALLSSCKEFNIKGVNFHALESRLGKTTEPIVDQVGLVTNEILESCKYKFIVIGHSMGGIIAIHLKEIFKERMLAAICIASPIAGADSLEVVAPIINSINPVIGQLGPFIDIFNKSSGVTKDWVNGIDKFGKQISSLASKGADDLKPGSECIKFTLKYLKTYKNCIVLIALHIKGLSWDGVLSLETQLADGCEAVYHYKFESDGHSDLSQPKMIKCIMEIILNHRFGY